MNADLGATAEWALGNGSKPYALELSPDFNVTLAVTGQRTRRNLRYYRRMCGREPHCRYEPCASVNGAASQELNRHSSYRVSRAVAAWRHASVKQFPNVFLAGLRDGSGRWLSLMGGRHEGTGVTMDWQMNRTGLERYSVGTAMRTFLVEHEGLRGSTSLSLEGGTPQHSVYHSFVRHSVYNLAVRRRWLLLRFIEAVLLRFFPKKFLTLAIVKPSRKWVPAGK